MPLFVSIVLRTVGTYFVLLVLTRLMGKREVSQLTLFDYITGISIGSIAGIMSVDYSKMWIYLLPGVVIFAVLQILTAYLSTKNQTIRTLINGAPTVLIKNGRIIEKSLAREKLSSSTLVSMLREKNAFKLADVEFAVMETDGKISVMFKPEKQPVTPSDLKMQTQYSGLFEIVIQDGNILGKSLKNMGLTVSWLMGKLAEKGIFDVSRVALALADNTGGFYVDLYDVYENIQQKNNSNEMLLSRLEKLHADFSTFSLETQNCEAQKFYKECGQITEMIASQFKQYIESNKE